jgi:ferredoxin
MEARKKVRVRFAPLGKELEIVSGATILAAANRCQAPIAQSCAGDGACGWCRVSVLDGAEHLSPAGELEQKLMKEKNFKRSERAACLARIHGDVTITTTYWGHE